MRKTPAPKAGTTHSSDPWTTATAQELRDLWLGRPENKMTATKIAGRLGRSKNSILGKLNRLRLLAQEGPRARRASPAVAAMLILRAEQCRFPVGELSAPDFHFCEADAKPGSPYCPYHYKRCYMIPKKTEKRSAAWTEERRAAAAQAARKRPQDRKATFAAAHRNKRKVSA